MSSITILVRWKRQAFGSSLKKSCVEEKEEHKSFQVFFPRHKIGDGGHCNGLVTTQECRKHDFPWVHLSNVIIRDKTNLKSLSVSNSH